MDFNFTMATGSWIIGKALNKLFPDQFYEEVDIGQTFRTSHLKVTRQQLDDALSKVEIATGSSKAHEETLYGVPMHVIEYKAEPAGDKFKLVDETWRDFKEWAKTHGEVVFEDEETIEVAENLRMSTRAEGGQLKAKITFDCHINPGEASSILESSKTGALIIEIGTRQPKFGEKTPQ